MKETKIDEKDIDTYYEDDSVACPDFNGPSFYILERVDDLLSKYNLELEVFSVIDDDRILGFKIKKIK